MNKSTYAHRGHWAASGSIGAVEVVACGDVPRQPRLRGAEAPRLLQRHERHQHDRGHDDLGQRQQRLLRVPHDRDDRLPLRGVLAHRIRVPVGRHLAGQRHLYRRVQPDRTYRQRPYERRRPSGPQRPRRWRLQELPRRARHDGSLRRARRHVLAERRSTCASSATTPVSPTTTSSSTSRSTRRRHGDTAATTRYGHKTTTPGVLPAGSAMPCYYCHNPHGSLGTFTLQVITMSGGATITIGDTTGEIDMTGTPAPASVREFCFTCHTTSDTGAGWNGIAMAVTNANDRVAGIPRFTASAGRLRLPVTTGHNAADAHSCYKCHGNDYSRRHVQQRPQPGRRRLDGGSKCYTCHTAYQPMEMNDAADAERLPPRARVVTTTDDRATRAERRQLPDQHQRRVLRELPHRPQLLQRLHPRARPRTCAPTSRMGGCTPPTPTSPAPRLTASACRVTPPRHWARTSASTSARTATPRSPRSRAPTTSPARTTTWPPRPTAPRTSARTARSATTTTWRRTSRRPGYQFGTHISAERNILSALGGTLGPIRWTRPTATDATPVPRPATTTTAAMR